MNNSIEASFQAGYNQAIEEIEKVLESWFLMMFDEEVPQEVLQKLKEMKK